jgi:hypothetical protein
MMSLNLKNVLSLLLLGFILGFFASFLFTGSNKTVTSKSEAFAKPKELKKQADTIQENYQEQIANLQDQNLELLQSLEVTQGLLDQEKLMCKQKEQHIKKLIEPKGYSAKALLAKVDSSKTVSNCDTLASLVLEYMEGSNQKDNLYEVQHLQMDSVVSVKDEFIEANQKAYSNLKLLFNQSITAQETLIKENKQLQRQFKRQRFRNKLVSIGLVILSATATKFLLHH